MKFVEVRCFYCDGTDEVFKHDARESIDIFDDDGSPVLEVVVDDRYKRIKLSDVDNLYIRL